MGETQKDIAKRLNVSPSYVSKVKNGKKQSYLHVIPNTTIKEDDIEVSTQDITEILTMVSSKHILTNTEDIIKYIESEVHRLVIRLKIYQEILRRIK